MLTPPVREKMIEIAARHGAGNLEFVWLRGAR